MARDYAKIYTSIRDDDEFRLLGPAAQGLYFQLLIGEVSKAGTFWWRPKKLAQLFGSTTPDDIETIGTELADHRFVLIDYDTDEALVRSFIRHDGILKSPNMVKSMVATWRDIGSQVIKDVVLNQVRREVERTPSLRDLHVLPEVFKEPSESVDETLPSGFPNRTLPETLTERVAETPRQGFAIRETGDGRQETDSKESPASHSQCVDDDFVEWWNHYPRKKDRGHALKAYRAARKKTDATALLAAVVAFAESTKDENPQFLPYGSTWLNGERWDDQADPKQGDQAQRSEWDQPEQPPQEALDDPDVYRAWVNERRARRTA